MLTFLIGFTVGFVTCFTLTLVILHTAIKKVANKPVFGN